MPSLSESTATFVRVAYGVLVLMTLLMALPQGARFFAAERWGGYIQDSAEANLLHSPFAWRLGLGVWLASAVALTFGWWSVLAALVNVVLCRHVFVRLRWQSVLRGMGAPGFMTYWLGVAVLLIEFSRLNAPSVEPMVVLVLLVDFAAIMLSAGVYKVTAGYPRNHGMEYGLVNPLWGYWWQQYRRLPPRHWLFITLNQLAWTTEIVGALLLLVPATRLVGVVVFVVSFAFIATQIRLGVLCHMVIVSALLFVPDGSAVDRAIGAVAVFLPASTVMPVPLADAIGAALMAGLFAYLALLPFAHGGLWLNFYTRRSLPGRLQRALDAYTNFFGIIIWRVFSVDVVNFVVRVYAQRGETRSLLSRYGERTSARFTHVGELIAITSLFTTLKYHPSDTDLFNRRLVRYARSLACPADGALVFAYASITKRDRRFGEVPLVEYIVDPIDGSVATRVLSDEFSVTAAHPLSPVHEGARPGSYAPLRA